MRSCQVYQLRFIPFYGSTVVNARCLFMFNGEIKSLLVAQSLKAFNIHVSAFITHKK